MLWRNLTLPKMKRVFFFRTNYGSHTTNINTINHWISAQRSYKNGCQETETRYNNNHSYPKNTWGVGGQGRIGNGGWNTMWPKALPYTKTHTPSWVWEKHFLLHLLLSQCKPMLIASNLRPVESPVTMGSAFSYKFVLGVCQSSAPVNYVHSFNKPIFKRLQVQFQQGFPPNTHCISFPPSAEWWCKI